ncbi:unnamed protein product [Effrenium voratum]|nr:unnamed protein product [Effrenium voratum]
MPGVKRARSPEGWKDVPGFEAVNLRVASDCKKKLPKTQSWCFVPLVFSALQKVPPHLVTPSSSSSEQIQDSQEFWESLFSHWRQWREDLQAAIHKMGEEKFIREFLPKSVSAKSWSTSAVYGKPKDFGRLPHPPGQPQLQAVALKTFLEDQR